MIKGKRQSKPDGAIFSAIRRVWNDSPIRIVEMWAREARALGPRGSGRAVAVAGKLGLDVTREKIGAGGILERYRGGFRVVLGVGKGGSVTPRENFIAAHELGHYIIRERLHEHLPTDVLDRETAQEEWLCNKFAAEFLMPTLEFASAIASDCGDPELFMGLSRRFGASLQATLVRAFELCQRQRKPFFAVIWTETAAGGERPGIRKTWSVPKQVGFAGDANWLVSAASSDSTTSSYHLITSRGKKHRLWCRTSTLTNDFRTARPTTRLNQLLTIGVPGVAALVHASHTRRSVFQNPCDTPSSLPLSTKLSGDHTVESPGSQLDPSQLILPL